MAAFSRSRSLVGASDFWLEGGGFSAVRVRALLGGAPLVGVSASILEFVATAFFSRASDSSDTTGGALPVTIGGTGAVAVGLGVLDASGERGLTRSADVSESAGAAAICSNPRESPPALP